MGYSKNINVMFTMNNTKWGLAHADRRSERDKK